MKGEGDSMQAGEADVTTIDGVRGFLNADDGTFWVTRHLGDDDSLDPGSIRKLRAILEAHPERVSGVNVLFSLREPAVRSEPMLSAAGLGAWFVDSETGSPRKV